MMKKNNNVPLVKNNFYIPYIKIIEISFGKQNLVLANNQIIVNNKVIKF